MIKGKKVLIVIPAYNEEESIVKTIDDIKKNAKGADYVIVNDGSYDNTLNVLKENNFNYIDLVQNMGIFGAVQTGLK